LYPQERNREIDSFKDESKDPNSFLGDMREEEIMEIVCYNSYTEEKTKKEKTVFHHTREKWVWLSCIRIPYAPCISPAH